MTLPLTFLLNIQGFAGPAEDEALGAKVRDAMILTPDLFDAFLNVTVKKGVVWIKGRALSEQERELAATVAQKVDGVREVKIEVEVRPLSAEDAETLKALRRSAEVQPVSPVAPPTTAKPRSLGPLPSGISSPADRMRDQQYQMQEDARIRRDVEFAIQMEAGAPRVQSVHVTVADGVVTLTGVADDRYVRTKVENATRRVRGVKRVSNQILAR